MAADQRLADLQQQAAAESVAWETVQRMAGMDVGMMTIPETFKALRMWNVAAAEAASLAMDRQAVATMRSELDRLIRGANLAAEAADNPAAVGLRAELELLPEERLAPSVRLGPDGRSSSTRGRRRAPAARVRPARRSSTSASSTSTTRR